MKLMFTLAAAFVAATAVSAFAAPATPPAGGVAGTQKAQADLAYARTFDETYGNNAFGGRSQGQFGQEQSEVVRNIETLTGYDNYGQYLNGDGWTGSAE
jgi:hypothetical protein